MNVSRPNISLRTFLKMKVKFKKKKSFFKKRKLAKLNEFPENLRCSNINGAMHKLLVGECLTGATDAHSITLNDLSFAY